MELKIAVAKVDKYGASQSGDTVEVIERPNGGISVVLADGQMNQLENKAISTMVTHRVINHISQGIRDGAAIRATSNSLFNENNGTLSANLNVISVDLQTNTILLSRNNPIPVFIISEGKVDCLNADSQPIGSGQDISPSIVELPIAPGMAVIAFTDGVHNAGMHQASNIDICTTLESLFDEQEPTAQEIADFILKQSLRLDDGRPKDDMSVVVLRVSAQSVDSIRRLNVTFALD